MPLITLSITGLPNAQKLLTSRSGPNLAQASSRASVASLRAALPVVKGAMPVRTGFAKRNVRVARASRQDRPGAILGIRKQVRYRAPLVAKRPELIVPRARAQMGLIAETFKRVLHEEVNRPSGKVRK